MTSIGKTAVESLIGRLDAAVPTLLLIDPMLGEPLSALVHAPDATAAASTAAREEAWQRPTCPIALDQRVSLKASQAPYLVELQGMTDPWLEASVAWAEAERSSWIERGVGGSGRASFGIGGWLVSSAGMPQVAQRLSLLMRPSTVRAQDKHYLRLGDRRVLDLWRWQAGESAVHAALHPITAWHYLCSTGALETLVRSHDGPAGAPPCLAPAAWQVLMSGDQIHPCVAMWFGELTARGHELPRTQDAYAQVLRALERAREAARRWPGRFKAPVDDAAWAALTLLHGSIDEDAEVRRAVSAAPLAGEPLESLHDIAADLARLAARATPASSRH